MKSKFIAILQVLSIAHLLSFGRANLDENYPQAVFINYL